MSLTPQSELVSRRSRLQTAMRRDGLDAVIVLQSADLFYLTGTIQAGTLYVPVDGDALYFVRKDLERARRESALTRIVPLTSLRELPAAISKHGCTAPKRIGFEFDVVPVATFERYRALFDGAVCVDASLLLRQLRMLKSAYEIELMRGAAKQADRVFQTACAALREGMTDLELASELERVARLDGHPGLIRMRSFNGEMVFAHVFSGPDSAVPAYLDTPLGGVGVHPCFGQGAGTRRIRPHEPVIVDTGSFYDGYLADQTRVLSIGALPGALVRAYEDMLRVQALMQGLVAPGVVWADVYERCRELAVSMGYADHFMGYVGSQAGFIGHGLGIEIDEFPVIAPAFTKQVFEPAMVFAFEPKAVFPGLGAVGIENTFVVREHGIEALTVTSEELAIVA
jgi:Xaa-Pro dipeptidase